MTDVTPAALAQGARGAEVPAGDGVLRRAAIVQILILAAVVFLTALDQTVVVTALLPMSQSLGLTPKDLPDLSWVISGYLLGYVVVMPLMGRVADLWGRRRLMLLCLGVFAVGSLLCVESSHLAAWWDFASLRSLGLHVAHPALAWLILARFVQAVGGGAVVPIALASSGTLFGERRRSVALGFISGVTEAGGALGPLYGATILEKWPFLFGRYHEPWQWLFLLNLPLVALLGTLLWLTWPARSRDADEEAVPERGGIDWLGAVLLGAALLCLSLGLSQQAGAMVKLVAEQQAKNNPYLLAAAGALLLGFIALERRRSAPLVPLQFFRSGTFTASGLLSLLTGAVLIVALVNVPLFAYVVLRQSHLAAGLLLLRLTVMIPLGAFAGGWLVARVGARSVGAFGATVIAAGFLLMSRWTPLTDARVLTLGTVVSGMGFGLVLAPISTTALQAVAAARFGVAAAVSTSLRMIGMILGLAALTSWEVGRYRELFAALRAAPPGPGCFFECLATRLETAVQQASTQAMTETFLVAACVAALGLLPALFLRRPTQD